MGELLRILIVEDSEDDAELLLRQLRQGGYQPEYKRVASAEAMRGALEQESWDIIISDYVMPGFGGMEALGLFREKALGTPFIVVSGHIGEDIAVGAMKAGADDYVMKDRLARLAPAVKRALQEAKIRRAHKQAHHALLESEERYRQLAEELRKSNEELTTAREALELRVQARTADLTAANAELQRQMTERKRLENELLEIAENERRRIGFDLHDDIGQKLMGGSLLLKALEKKLAQKRLPGVEDTRKVQEVLGHVINHTHDLAHCFSALDVEGDDLRGLMTQLVASVKRTFRAACVFRVAGDLPVLPKDTSLQLYKIAQESISNAIKHGKAKKVFISIARRQGQVILRIKNDGVPFPVNLAPNRRMGLRIMNYRARTMGGTLEIRPNGKSGTLVVCTVPYINGHSAARMSSGTPEAKLAIPDRPGSATIESVLP